ncbi:hypothetical protein K503DRAFT_869723 [Rhizopogon vinicolor AM-OR11-026]|uniref:DUF6534 domain-containing protein n=1 Tax=Rhizopogon vinicolor AM-OR11-026 TaxID=1314800 RepID=A0A1B7MKM0_9AGAM|nr:hypothetical protein K503DRAFT_869723 [Rhizopogon vinicolor AM-OR11-026]
MSSSAQALAPSLDLGNTYGALFIGVVIAAMLFGVSNVQAFIYFQTHGDKWISFYKLVVIGLLILDALHLVLMVYSLYYYLVTNYANVGVLTEIVWSSQLEVLVGVFIIYVLHLLYVHRIWIVSRGRSKALPIIVTVVVVLSSGVSIVVIWETYQVRVNTDLIRIEWSSYMYLGTIASVDILIAASLWYLLATSLTGFSSMDSFLKTLITYIINTGGLTSICSLVDLITGVVMPRNFIFLSIQLLVAKVYINSFLALLNARYYMQPTKNTTNSAEYHIRPGPDQHINVLQDGTFQTSRKNMMKHSDEGELRPTRPVQAVLPRRPMAMNSISSV